MGFRDEVETSEWLADVERWIDDRLTERGWSRTGPGDQRRVRPWSTQVVVPSDHGPVWFKANNPRLAHEAAVHAMLARIAPDLVDEPLGVDAARGWLLTADRGRTLRDRDGLTHEDLAQVLAVTADLQRRAIDREAELLDAGLPDCRPQTVVARFDQLCEELAALPADHPSHLDADALVGVAGLRPGIVEAAALLGPGPLPSSFQHGDAHPGNVFAVDRGLRLFDFGDAQWAHVLESLAVPYGVALRAELPWPPLQAAYAEEWADLVSPAELDRLLQAAIVTHAVNRAQLWLWSVEGARPDELAEWGDGAVYFLRSALDPFEP
jgi:hypothetical protein